MKADSELKARHRNMWASGDYPSMVETFLLALETYPAPSGATMKDSIMDMGQVSEQSLLTWLAASGGSPALFR